MNFILKNLLSKALKTVEKEDKNGYNEVVCEEPTVVGMRSLAILLGTNDKSNLFYDCELFDVFLEDSGEIENFLIQMQGVYAELPKEVQRKPIFLNFDGANKCGYASHSKGYLLMPHPINQFLEFKNDSELKTCVSELINLHSHSH